MDHSPTPGYADSSGQPPTRQRYVVMTFLCVLSFLTYFDRVCIMRAQESIEKDLGLTKPQMGLVLGAFWLAYALFEIPGGWMGDRYGARVTLTRIVFAWSLFTVLSGAATGFVTLLTFRLLFGAGEAGAFPNMARVQSEWLPARTRGRAGGLLWLLARWGGAFSPLIFGALMGAFNSAAFRSFLTRLDLPGDIPGWRVAFWTTGLIGAVWCVTFYVWFRDDPAAVPSVNDAELRLIRSGAPPVPAHVRMPAGAWRALLTSRSLWALGCLYICGSFGWSFFVSWMPLYLKEAHGMTFAESEVEAGLPLFCGGITCLLGGWLSDRVVRRTGRKWLGRALFPMAGFTTAAVAMYCVPLARESWQVTALLCVANAGHDFGQGANWATIVDLGGRFAGTAAGFINMVGNAGNYLQPFVGAVIFQTFGWNALFGVYAVVFLAAGAMWLLIDPNHTFYGPETPPEVPAAAEENAGPPAEGIRRAGDIRGENR